MIRRFNYPKHFEKEKRIPRLRKKRIGIAEVSLGDFTGRLRNDLLNWFSTTPQHWIMLHAVMLAYFKNQSITKNQLLKVIEKSYLTSNIYIDTAIKKGYFRIIRNNKDAGHYHFDVTPEKIEYEGYFNTAAEVHRVNNIYKELANKNNIE